MSRKLRVLLGFSNINLSSLPGLLIKSPTCFISKCSSHLWKMSSKDLKDFRKKILTKSCGYT